VYFEDKGLGDGTPGSAQKILDRLGSELSGLQLSDVTGEDRIWSLIPTPATNPKVGQSLGGITFDIATKDLRAEQRALLNILGLKFAASETRFTQANGMIEDALWDGDGNFLFEAAIDVATNRFIPSPHPPRLEATIGCMQCHNTEGSDGWKPLRNELDDLRKEIDILGDLSKLNLARDKKKKSARAVLLAATVSDLAQRFTGSPDETLSNMRRIQQRVFVGITGGIDQKLVDTVKNASQTLSAGYNHWRYDLIDARQALAECGLKIDGDDPEEVKKKATETFR
jgi:hypothetical protein